MTANEFRTEAIKKLDRIPPERYESVLAQLEGAASRPRGTPGRELLKFAGSISDETAEEMLRIIEEECERIDYESWGLPPGHERRDRAAS